MSFVPRLGGYAASLTIPSRLIDAFAPALTEVPIKGNPTLEQAFYRTDRRPEVSFLIIDCALSLSPLEMNYFNKQTDTMPSGWFFSLRSLRSLTLREGDLYRLGPAGAVVPFMSSGEDLWLLLLSANALGHFTICVPVSMHPFSGR